MTLTAEELKSNYYFACLQVAGTPYIYMRSDIILSALPASGPYIKTWTVAGVSQPNDAYMLANCDMTTIGTIADACNGV